MPAPVTTSRLRLFGDPTYTNHAYSVSEIQAFGNAFPAVPEPGEVALLMTDLPAFVGLAARRRGR